MIKNSILNLLGWGCLISANSISDHRIRVYILLGALFFFTWAVILMVTEER